MRAFKRFVTLALVMAALLALMETGAAQEQPRSGRDLFRGPRGAPGAQLKIGQPAPEFELPPLVFEKNEKGEKVGKIGTERVQLSAFRGKKIVCIFSSSYT